MLEVITQSVNQIFRWSLVPFRWVKATEIYLKSSVLGNGELTPRFD